MRGDVSEPPAVNIGDVIAGKYRVDRILGEGGMGVVVAATHAQLDQHVALKFLRPSLVSNVEVGHRFMREARAAVKIHSEHVARVLDVGVTDAGTPFMVMEYLEGEDLEQVLAGRGRLSVEDSVRWLLQTCEALAEAHVHGIVHRDLKPANLFLAKRPGGTSIVKVLDFGISKAIDAKDGAATSATALMGSPLYMSPEQMTSPGDVDLRTDVWCLGIVLYEMLTGRMPFRADTMPRLVYLIAEASPEPLRDARPEVPEGLAAVVDRCLRKKREDRFQNVGELARALAPFGPPRSEQSVERIEQVLQAAGALAAPLGAGLLPPAGDPRPGAVAHRPEGLTFVPTTSQISQGRSRWYILPLALAVSAVAVATITFLAVRRTHPSVASLPSTTPVAAPAPAPTPVPAEPSSSAPVEALAPPAAPAVSSAPAPSSSVPWWYGKPASTAAHPAPRPTAAASGTPACHIVSFFDADGNKHFKQECP
jgi:eukaryotic-like serine/threonine-protein kinase